MKYTAEYFIDKFQSIPSNKWFKGDFVNPKDNSCRCALGHCGVDSFGEVYTNKEASALISIMGYQSTKLGTDAVTDINDSGHMYSYLGKTPKQRIINRLKEIKDAIDTTGIGHKD